MYSRPNDPRSRDVRIPHNYGGSIFGSQDTPTRAVPVRDNNTQGRPQHAPSRPPRPSYETHNTPNLPERQPEPEYRECPVEDIPECEGCERCDKCELNEEHEKSDKCEKNEKNEGDNDKKPFSILSPIGALGTEELLLIALALIIFQSGKEPELALLLLALLFIN
ncbi:MAG: hypothetical protein J6B72_01910 [Clostridia bacterium]|nr:hypothetical protein [Clostridia bacterium]